MFFCLISGGIHYELGACTRDYRREAGGLQFYPSAQFIGNADTGRISGSANRILPRGSGIVIGGTSKEFKLLDFFCVILVEFSDDVGVVKFFFGTFLISWV